MELSKGDILDIKQFLTDNKALLTNSQYEELYEKLRNSGIEIPKFTKFLVDAGIDPIQHGFTKLPVRYAAGLHEYLQQALNTKDLHVGLLGTMSLAGTGITELNLTTTADDGCFIGCRELTSATIDVTNVGRLLFANCPKLSSVKLTTNVKYIGGKAFGNCPALKVLDIPDSIENFADNAFAADTIELRMSEQMKEKLRYVGFGDNVKITVI